MRQSVLCCPSCSVCFARVILSRKCASSTASTSCRRSRPPGQVLPAALGVAIHQPACRGSTCHQFRCLGAASLPLIFANILLPLGDVLLLALLSRRPDRLVVFSLPRRFPELIANSWHHDAKHSCVFLSLSLALCDLDFSLCTRPFPVRFFFDAAYARRSCSREVRISARPPC